MALSTVTDAWRAPDSWALQKRFSNSLLAALSRFASLLFACFSALSFHEN